MLAVAAGALLPALSLAAGAAPVPGRVAACRESPPVVLQAGAAPLAPLRVELAAVAGARIERSATYREAIRSRYADGYAHTSHTSEKERISYVAAAHAAGGAVAVKAHTELATASDGAATKHRSSSFSLRLDGLDRGNADDVDHLPATPVGIGASWRIVFCNYTGSFPVITTRVYTLRSVANAVVSLSFRDEVTLDPLDTDLGPVDHTKHAQHYSLLSLSGSTTGTERIPLANPLAQTLRSESRTSLTYAIGDTGEGLVRTTLVSSSTQGA